MDQSRASSSAFLASNSASVSMRGATRKTFSHQLHKFLSNESNAISEQINGSAMARQPER
jgi:hypothetical protein